jgi:hypothetical protein
VKKKIIRKEQCGYCGCAVETPVFEITWNDSLHEEKVNSFIPKAEKETKADMRELARIRAKKGLPALNKDEENAMFTSTFTAIMNRELTRAGLRLTIDQVRAALANGGGL